jgi:hypothetical protein
LRVSGDGAPGGSRLIPALRVRDDLAIAVLPGDAQVDAVEGAAAASGNPVVARDEVRGLVLVRVPAQPVHSLPVQPQNEPLELPAFLVIIDAAPGGPAIRAEFVSRATTATHPAWDGPILALGGVANVRPGSMVFTLAGRFVGMVLPDDEDTLVAPAEALIARADRLTRGESVLAANARLAVQPLSPSLAKATKATHGVIVAAIDGAVVTAWDAQRQRPTGPATVLRVGDVIEAIDSDEIRSFGDWERILSHRAPGTTVTLRVVRPEGRAQVRLMLMWRDALLAPASDGNMSAARATAARRANAGDGAAAFGLVLRAASATTSGTGALEVARVEPGSAAARAGLRAGDRLTALPAAFPASAARANIAEMSSLPPPPAPLTLARVDAAFNALASGDALLLAISRAGQPLVVAVDKP